MKRIRTFFKLDMALSFRDSLLIYSLISPMLLALLLRLILPSVQEISVNFAVDQSVDNAVVRNLEDYGRVEIFPDRETLLDRVQGNDDLPGISFEDGKYLVTLEGNEDAEAGAGTTALLQDATGSSEHVSFEVISLGGKPVPVKEYAAAALAMLSLFIGGILVGFNIVDEKETKVIRALAVSPLRMSEYISARGLLAVAIGLLSGVAAAAIMLGGQVDFLLLTVSMLIAFFVALPFGFIIGAWADNQMTAFALVKLLMLVFMTFPFVTLFIPAHWQWPFFILPNYWMFSTLCSALGAPILLGWGWSALLTGVSGSLMTLLLIPKLRKGLKLR